MKPLKKWVGNPIPKKDAMALLMGKPVYTEDLAPENCLVVKLMRSPYANARIRDIEVAAALRLPGIACVLTWKDVPDRRFTLAGQTYPEPSPYDHLILDEHVRFVGDPVAIVAGENEAAVKQALKRIRIDYEVLEPVLDFTKALDNEVVIHPEANWKSLCDVGADPQRNRCAHGQDQYGDVEAELARCKWRVEETYHTKANQQVNMETYRAFTMLDAFGRLTCVTSTQIPFHIRHILSNALDIPKSRIRVVKPRVGGGFGAKQTAAVEIYPAIVTLKTGKPAMIVYSREESLTASFPRHEMAITVRLGADEQGIIRAIDMYTLSNTGAYGEHGPTTVVLSGHKSIPLYGKAKAYRYGYDVVYTNKMASGAYRGYGATQGTFALESAVDELAAKMQMDPIGLRERNMVKAGDFMPAYFGEQLNSCALNKCMETAKKMIGWHEKYPFKELENGKISSVGVAMSMQGSGIAGVDTATVTIRLNDDGFYTLAIGAADMGTGCDTILAQMAADCLDCPVERILVLGVDTDSSPYDTGSYASSTTYVTGTAVIKACQKLAEKIRETGAIHLNCRPDAVAFDGDRIYELEGNREIPIIALLKGGQFIQEEASFMSPVSPPPFIVGMAEIEIDVETGVLELKDYVAVVDCGTVINPILARVQTEGGILQGIGMALYEDVVYSEKGQNYSHSLMNYKIPSRLDCGPIRVAFESSEEPTGPFGAKSIGELVINTPSPAIANAVYQAVGVRIRELPITAEKIFYGMRGI